MYRVVFIVLSVFSFSITYGQEHAENSVVIHSDPRLAVLLKKYRSPVKPPREAVNEDGNIAHTTMAGTPGTHPANTIPVHRIPVVLYRGKGYRVQIYNGQDRNKALSVKMDFMKKFPAVHTYIVYTSPSFRVKVGDYRIRKEAEQMLKEVNAVYHPSMIVPDDVTITGFQ